MITRLMLAATALLLSGCVMPVEEPPPPPPGEPATYVCMRNANVGCIRGEWRCPSPLQMRAGEDGQPRCVMPGRDY